MGPVPAPCVRGPVTHRMLPPSSRFRRGHPASSTWIALLSVVLLATSAFAQDDGASEGGSAGDASAPVDEDAAKEAKTAKDDEAETKSTGLSLQERIRAVSNPVFATDGRFEGTLYHGFSINDAFRERLQLGARFNYHLFEWLSLEGGGTVNYFSVPLPTIRMDDGNAPDIPDDTPYIATFDVGATVSPIYGKVSLMSEWVLHFDAYLVGGVGGIILLNDDIFAPAATFGVGTHLVALEWLTVRAELRNYMYPDDINANPAAFLGGAKITNLLMLNIGVSVFFPFEVERKDIGVVKVDG